jgi:hypothetical protein
MSSQADPTPEDAPKVKKGSSGRGLTAPFRGRSLAARAAIVFWLFLVLLVIVAGVLFSLNPLHVPWRHAMSWTHLALVLALTFVTPFTLYWALRLWLITYRSRFPEIDRAWAAGVQALRRNGISLRTTPVFLILGSPSPELEQSLMESSGREFAVRGVPEGSAPLHWYASADCVYVVCSEVGWLSRLNRVVHQHRVKDDSPLAAIARDA